MCVCVCALVGWLVGRFGFSFYGISTIVGYLMPNPFLYLLAVPFQTVQFSISIVFCLHTVKCQNSSISNNSV